MNEVLSNLDNVKELGGERWSARCPAHSDQKNSLSVALGDSGKVLLHCFAGCEYRDILAALNLASKDLLPTKKESQAETKKQVIATYTYTDEQGRLLYQVVRYHPKDFRQRRPDGKGGWNYTLGDVRRVLYRLLEVRLDVSKGKTVFIAEGEKDCDRLNSLGLCATTNAMGASAKWIEDYCLPLKGANVVLLPDNDLPGVKHMDAVAKATTWTGRGRKASKAPLTRKPSKND